MRPVDPSDVETKRSVLIVAAVLLLAGGWVVRARSSGVDDPANAERRAALEACAQRIEGTDVTVCVPAGWVPLTVGKDRKGEPQTTTEAVAYDGNAFNIELHDASGHLLARTIMTGTMEPDDSADSEVEQAVAAAMAPEPELGRAFDSTSDPVAQAQAVLAAVTAKDPVNTQSGRTPVALPPGTVPGAVAIADAPSFSPYAWNVIRGDHRYRITAVWDPRSTTPADEPALTAAVTDLLRTWTWNET